MIYLVVRGAQDQDKTIAKMVKLLLAATEYPKFATMMKKFAGGDKDACEKRAMFFRDAN